MLRGTLRLLGAIPGVDRVLVSFVRLGGSELNALLRARIDVLDHLAVAGGKLIELVDAILDGLSLPLHILLAGKWVQVAPETFVSIRLQGLLAAGAGLGGSRCRGSLGCRLVLGGGIGLRKRGHGKSACQEQSQSYAIGHFQLPPRWRSFEGPSPSRLTRVLRFDLIASQQMKLAKLLGVAGIR